MNVHGQVGRPGRRAFLKQVTAIAAGASSFLGNLGEALAQMRSTAEWKQQIGLEMYTVRDVQAADYEGTLAKVAKIGYKEVELDGNYNNMDPKSFRAMLDRYGLSAPSTHAGARGTGADLEKQLEGFQTMGIQYTLISAGPAGGGAGRSAPAAPMSEEAVKRSAQQINANGKIAKKYGMKVIFHNQVAEFEPLDTGKLTRYDVLLRETDRDLVAMQLDIGWAAVAGQDIVEMFKKAPGRFELWHVKDATGLKRMDPRLTSAQRQQFSQFMPVGLGDVDYKAIFANAELAGLKHFCVEQDNASAWADSIAAAQVSYQALVKLLS